MGFSTAAAAAIIGITMLMVIEISLGTILPVYVEIQESFIDMSKRARDMLQTSIYISSVNITVNGSGYDLNITLENTGSTVIDMRCTHVLIEGINVSSSYSCTYLYPKNNGYITVNGLSGNGEKTLKIITENGIGQYEKYIA